MVAGSHAALPSRRYALAALGGLVFATTPGCAGIVDDRAAELIRQELPRLVGPAAAYEVLASGVSAARGELASVRVVGRRVARPSAPVIERADVHLQDVRIDSLTRRVTAVGAATATVRVLAADVAAFLDARNGLDEVEVAFAAADEVSIACVPNIAGVALPAGARVRLRGRLLPAASRLDLQVLELRVAGMPLGTWAQTALQTLINPIFDLAGLPAPTRVTAARVEGAALIIEADGAAAVPAATG